MSYNKSFCSRRRFFSFSKSIIVGWPLLKGSAHSYIFGAFRKERWKRTFIYLGELKLFFEIDGWDTRLRQNFARQSHFVFQRKDITSGIPNKGESLRIRWRKRPMKSRMLAAILILLGLFMLVHHLYLSGRLFDPEDILHHEFFEAIVFTAGVVLLACSSGRHDPKNWRAEHALLKLG